MVFVNEYLQHSTSRWQPGRPWFLLLLCSFLRAVVFVSLWPFLQPAPTALPGCVPLPGSPSVGIARCLSPFLCGVSGGPSRLDPLVYQRGLTLCPTWKPAARTAQVCAFAGSRPAGPADRLLWWTLSRGDGTNFLLGLGDCRPCPFESIGLRFLLFRILSLSGGLERDLVPIRSLPWP